MKYSLPESATDLLIKDAKLLIKSLNVYEILRRFSHIIRLTPFRFEDFQAALISLEQSTLLSEIHIQLLKTLLREDKLQQTWLGPPDIRDSINLYLHLADHSNWPTAIKIYLSASLKENSEILEKLNLNENKDYPFNVGIELKLDLLEHLCDQFLLSNLARDDIVGGNNNLNSNGTTYGNSSYNNTSISSIYNNNIKHDNICRQCAKTGNEMIYCSNCPAIYHLKCSDPPLETYPSNDDDETYLCVICRSNHIPGVSDCISAEERNGSYKRHEALGMDKLGRRYWFLVRRLFVIDENEEDVRYYSNINQLQEIINSLHENRFEKGLIENLNDHQEEIERQMKITEKLYETLLKDHKKEDGSYSISLGQDGRHKNYTNHYVASSNLALSKNQSNSEKEFTRSLNNKFNFASANSFKWHGSVNGHLTIFTFTIKSTLIRFESMLPSTFIHPCWQKEKSSWIRCVNNAQKPEDFAMAFAKIESCIKPILFKAAWYDGVGFLQLFRSTLAEREELKKVDRQPRGFERREWFSHDFELSYKLGTAVKFSSKLKPVKHQVWKQKGEEYRLTGLNGWSWTSCSFRKLKSITCPATQRAKPFDWTTIKKTTELTSSQKSEKKTVLFQAKLPPCHNFLTKKSRVRSMLILPDLELKKLARCAGMRESRSFNYTAKQNNYVWPYGMTPRPSFRTCWLYRNCLIKTMQDVSLQLKVLYACIRWDDLQVRPPATGYNVITTDEATVTIELLKKRDRLPYLIHSEYLIKKVTTPIEQPTKYRKVGAKKSTPSARSGLRARRQTDDDEDKGPTTEEVWVSEYQLELWELKQFDEKIERQNQILRERAAREEAERKRKLEEEKRRKAEQERRRKADEEAAKARLNFQATTPQVTTVTPTQIIRPTNGININQPQRLATSTPVIRYLRTEQGQIIRLPASYLQRGTPLILRHVSPVTNQTNTYIIRPQVMPVTTNIIVRPTVTATTVSSTASTTTPAVRTVPTIIASTATTASSSTATTTSSSAAATTITVSTASEPMTTATPTTATTKSTTTTTPTAVTATTNSTANSIPNDTSSATTANIHTPKPIIATTVVTTSNAAVSEAPVQQPQPPPSDIPTLIPKQEANQPAEAPIFSAAQPEEKPSAESKSNSNSNTDPDSAAQQQKESVGTVANELTHDQHAPTATTII